MLARRAIGAIGPRDDAKVTAFKTGKEHPTRFQTHWPRSNAVAATVDRSHGGRLVSAEGVERVPLAVNQKNLEDALIAGFVELHQTT